MRLNLFFKDAKINQLSPSEYEVIFKIDDMIKPKLSKNTRMYLEHFTLCEWFDDTFGVADGDIKGMLQVSSPNIRTSEDWSSGDDQYQNTIIFQTPLENYRSFVNTNPMTIYNFEINSDFLNRDLKFLIEVFDENGDPFTVQLVKSRVPDTTTTAYTDYVAITALLPNLVDNKNILEPEYEDLETEYEKLDVLLQQLILKEDSLSSEVDTGVADYIKATKSKRLAAKINYTYSIQKTKVLNEINYHFNNINLDKEPYNNGRTDVIKEWFEAYKEQIKTESELELLEQRMNDYENTNDLLYTNYSSIWVTDSAKTNQVESKEYTLTYSEKIASVKTGEVDVKLTTYDNSDTGFTMNVTEIRPFNDSTAQKLVKDDVLVLDGSVIDILQPDTEIYKFIRDSSQNITGFSYDNMNTLTTNVEFAIDVTRTGTTYTVALNNNIVPSVGFQVGSIIKIKGNILGGVTPANDLEIEVDGAYIPLATETFTLSNVNSTGIDITIERDNYGSNIYTVNTVDFSATAGFDVGDKITILGSDLGGNSPDNDFVLEVTGSVPDSEKYEITTANTLFMIKNGNTYTKELTVDSTNSTCIQTDGITASTGSNINASLYIAYNVNGDPEYNITLYPADASIGYTQDDVLTVTGDKIGGVTPDNDFTCKLNVDATGKIDTFTDITGTPRAGKGMKLELIRFNNGTLPTYNIVEPGEDYKNGDRIFINGPVFDGVVNTHYNTIQLDADVADNGKITNVSIIRTESVHFTEPIGMIRTYKFSGTAFYDTRIGEILSFAPVDSKYVAVDTTTIQSQNIELTLTGAIYDYGINQINSLILQKKADAEVKRNAFTYKNNTHVLQIQPEQVKRLKSMNMSLVLYDEIDEITQASYGAITGNTYSRLTGCQFKRI